MERAKAWLKDTLPPSCTNFVHRTTSILTHSSSFKTWAKCHPYHKACPDLPSHRQVPASHASTAHGSACFPIEDQSPGTPMAIYTPVSSRMGAHSRLISICQSVEWQLNFYEAGDTLFSGRKMGEEQCSQKPELQCHSPLAHKEALSESLLSLKSKTKQNTTTKTHFINFPNERVKVNIFQSPSVF